MARGHGRWWAGAAAAVALAAVIGGLTVATGCVSVASACVGQTLEVRSAQEATPDDPGVSALEEVDRGEAVALVGYGFAQCDDTGSAFCSRNGQVTGPREIAFVWRQSGRPDATVAEGRIEDGGSFTVSAVVPDDASPGQARLLVMRDGGVAADAVVRVAG
ncbi:hypothetical protein KIN34_12920 [Cellulomonas sp. DKR-3]|uniref:Uncharacterized protein n=1 Tax=Cellulomonas fulva TaxID=2835530 RepID=A0ABS5U1A3_9CELL|nr:hypothetical protein [Cellulomonas fulva]MBT0995185.1 hypothetical protein [Cellulomonas fulva]